MKPTARDANAWRAFARLVSASFCGLMGGHSACHPTQHEAISMDNYRISDKMQSAVKLAVMNRDIARASRKLGPQIHYALVQNLIHIQDHGDTSLLNRLFSVLPKGSRLKSYFVWCEKFAPLKISRNAKSFGCCKVAPGHKREEFDIGGAMAIAPWDLESPNKGDAKVLDFDGLVKLVTRQARKSIDAGKFTVEQVRGLSDRVAADLVTIQA